MRRPQLLTTNHGPRASPVTLDSFAPAQKWRIVYATASDDSMWHAPGGELFVPRDRASSGICSCYFPPTREDQVCGQPRRRFRGPMVPPSRPPPCLARRDGGFFRWSDKRREFSHRWTQMNTDGKCRGLSIRICVYLCPSVAKFPSLFLTRESSAVAQRATGRGRR